MSGKPFWQSKTFWVNVLIVVVIILESTGVIDVVPDEVQLEQYAILIVGLINIVLRFVTKEPITLRNYSRMLKSRE